MMKALKTLAAQLYGCAIRLRRTAYEHEWLETRSVDPPSICVGNLSLGGTGKTPMVGYLSRLLLQRGFRPVILSRGYRSPAENRTTLVSDGRQILSSPDQCGDEAYLLASQNPRAYVVAGKNRFRSAQSVLERVENPAFILDDGFQHLAFHCAVNLVLMDSTVPLEQLRLLPLGRLREPLDALARASAVVLTRTHLRDASVQQYRKIQQEFAPGSRLFLFGHRPLCLIDAADHKEAPLQAFKGQKAIAFAAIGNPDQFLKDLRDLEIQVVGQHLFRDHHRFSSTQIQSVLDEANRKEARMILTTEKDAVNLPHRNFGKGRIWALRIEPFCLDQPAFEQWLESELTRIESRRIQPAGTPTNLPKISGSK